MHFLVLGTDSTLIAWGLGVSTTRGHHAGHKTRIEKSRTVVRTTFTEVLIVSSSVS